MAKIATKKPNKNVKEKTHKFNFSFSSKSQPESFNKNNYDTVNLKAGTIKFGRFYGKKSLKYRLIVSIVIGIVMAFVIQLTLKNTGLYNSGLMAVVQGIARITQASMGNAGINAKITTLIFNLLFWGLYFILNIPLFVFSFKKIGKTFTLITIVFVFINTVVGLGISYIPNIDHIFIFGNTVPAGETHDLGQPVYPWTPYDHIGTETFPNPLSNLFAQKGVYVIPFDFNGDNWQVFNPDYDPYKAVMLFIYALVYGLISAICYACLYIVGGCTAGGDFVSIYYSINKHKPLGGLMIIVNGLCLLIGAITGSYISAGIIDKAGFNWQFLLSANLVASVIYVVVFGILLNHFYPLHQMVKVEIMSEKINTIKNYLFANNYTHSMSINKMTGAYTGKNKDMLWTVCLYVETPNIIRLIRKVDDKATILISTVRGVDGTFKIYRQGSEQ